MFWAMETQVRTHGDKSGVVEIIGRVVVCVMYMYAHPAMVAMKSSTTAMVSDRVC